MLDCMSLLMREEDPKMAADAPLWREDQAVLFTLFAHKVLPDLCGQETFSLNKKRCRCHVVEALS
jgi:hypothetical protein